MTKHNDYKVLDRFREQLQRVLPELQWDCRGIQALRGQFENSYRLRLCQREKFAYLFFSGLVARTPELLLDINSLVLAPLRVAKRCSRGAPYLRASWPIELSTADEANVLGADLRRLIFGPLQVPAKKPINSTVRDKLRDIASASKGFKQVPANEKSFEFVIGKGKNSLQIRALQPRCEVLSLTTLVTSYTANEKLVQRVVAMTMFMLNSHLKWTRLVLHDNVVEAEVTIPVSALSDRVWPLIKQALYQAVSLRDTVRIVQEPSVAKEAESILINKTKERRC